MNRADVGGYELSYRRWGEGYPVVFVAAMGTRASDWAATVYEMKEPVDAFTYSRPGAGGSDARPDRGPHGPRALADELGRVLAALKIPRPAVFVGHSIGCHIVRIYAADHPDEVSGIVLVEPSFDDLALLPDDPRVWTDGDADRAAKIDADLCVAELRDAAPLPPVPAAVVSRTPGRWYEAVWREAPGLSERWHANQVRLAQLLNAEHYVAEDSDHLVTEEDPQLIAQAVDEVVQAARGESSAPTTQMVSIAESFRQYQIYRWKLERGASNRFVKLWQQVENSGLPPDGKTALVSAIWALAATERAAEILEADAARIEAIVTEGAAPAPMVLLTGPYGADSLHYLLAASLWLDLADVLVWRRAIRGRLGFVRDAAGRGALPVSGAVISKVLDRLDRQTFSEFADLTVSELANKLLHQSWHPTGRGPVEFHLYWEGENNKRVDYTEAGTARATLRQIVSDTIDWVTDLIERLAPLDASPQS